MSKPCALYDFESMKEVRFPAMTDADIMREYVMVIRELDNISESMTQEDYLDFSEPLLLAEHFLSGYLARLLCYQCGLEV